ncbi:hypothetical protein [Tranquillimonas alkanivorans]|uniref:Uncharacterized protein n=1 Tax=Tranquillimonas alkanivorans TaxID=441119 RepID=A0A1I5P3I8_9RHOB|nr:hypothetical protein [Tranquillimonas alkanivorans]SFP28537.1 hypothetical protein SAMN04488047_104216 [Tranquillimonas alkanivorans]
MESAAARRRGEGSIQQRILCVGCPPNASPPDRQDPSIQYAGYDEALKLLEGTNPPSLILSPIIERDFDCLDLALALARTGFVGRYRAFAQGLRDASHIVEEVRARAPGLDFDIVEMPAAPLRLA